MRTGKKARPILDKANERHIYTLAELAIRMGWSIPTASKKINAPESMTIKEAKRLCQLTGFTLEELAHM